MHAVERRVVAAHLRARPAPDTGLIVALSRQASAGRGGCQACANVWRLEGERIRLHGDREDTLRQGHVHGRLRAQGGEGFACGVPAGAERGEVRRSTCGLTYRPPVLELLVPPSPAA